MFTVQTSTDGLQNNTMIIIYVSKKGNHIFQHISYYFKQDSQAVMFLNRFRSLFAEVLPMAT